MNLILVYIGTNPPRLKSIVTKSEEVKTGLICQGRHRKERRPQRKTNGQSFLRRPGPTRDCRANDDDGDDDYIGTVDFFT